MKNGQWVQLDVNDVVLEAGDWGQCERLIKRKIDYPSEAGM